MNWQQSLDTPQVLTFGNKVFPEHDNLLTLQGAGKPTELREWSRLLSLRPTETDFPQELFVRAGWMVRNPKVVVNAAFGSLNSASDEYLPCQRKFCVVPN